MTANANASTRNDEIGTKARRSSLIPLQICFCNRYMNPAVETQVSGIAGTGILVLV